MQRARMKNWEWRKNEKDRLKKGVRGGWKRRSAGRERNKAWSKLQAVNERKRRGGKEIRNFLQEKLCKVSLWTPPIRSVNFKAMLSWRCAMVVRTLRCRLPPVALSPRINYRVSVTADGSPTLPCSHWCILGERQVLRKVVCVCVWRVCVCVCVWNAGGGDGDDTLTCIGMCLKTLYSHKVI